MSEIINADIIEESVAEILNSIPADIILVAAAKTRTPEEVQAALWEVE